jgi:hypothetical protein
MVAVSTRGASSRLVGALAGSGKGIDGDAVTEWPGTVGVFCGGGEISLGEEYSMSNKEFPNSKGGNLELGTSDVGGGKIAGRWIFWKMG